VGGELSGRIDVGGVSGGGGGGGGGSGYPQKD
jgi:hypothetical protein